MVVEPATPTIEYVEGDSVDLESAEKPNQTKMEEEDANNSVQLELEKNNSFQSLGQYGKTQR